MTNILAAEQPDKYTLTWSEWRKLWSFTRVIDAPAADITLMTPYGFVRFMWYTTSKEFKAWPTTLDSGVVIGWRWPFQNRFKEKSWLKSQVLPLALYGAMDYAYTVRAAMELGWSKDSNTVEELKEVRRLMPYIAAAIREINKLDPQHGHNLWIPNCPDCARRALSLATRLMAEPKPNSVPKSQMEEHPLVAFQRRQAEAEKRLGIGARSVPELPEGTSI